MIDGTIEYIEKRYRLLKTKNHSLLVEKQLINFLEDYWPAIRRHLLASEAAKEKVRDSHPDIGFDEIDRVGKITVGKFTEWKDYILAEWDNEEKV